MNVPGSLDLHTLVNEITPANIFGVLSGSPDEQLKTLGDVYRRLVRDVHPDLHPNDPNANAANVQLNRLWQAAQEQIRKGEYGNPLITPVIIHSKTKTYQVLAQFGSDELSNYYDCILPDGTMGIFKVARSPKDIELLENEATFLAKLPADFPLILTVLETFAYREDGVNIRRQATVFSRVGNVDPREFVSLAQIRTAYPDGIDPKDAVWMFRRILAAVAVCGEAGVVHAAVLPSRVLVYPENHGVLLSGWEAAVMFGDTVSVVVPAYEALYPPEVLARKAATPALDIYMAVQCFAFLLGNDHTPEFRAFIRGCLFDNAAARPQNAWDLLDEFDALIERMWGKRQFHVFTMPAK